MIAVDTRLARLGAVAFIALALAACDAGGPSSQSNPNLTTSAGGYTGPAARTADILSFQNNFWQFLKEENRCGQCHGAGTSPEFVDPDDVNAAYSQAIAYVDLQSPADSEFVTKVGDGHNCWAASTNACADSIESMIVNWADDSDVTSKRVIQLTAPETLRDPGDAKSFPASAFDVGNGSGGSFADTVHDLLIGDDPVIANDNCQNCHEEIATPLPQAPFFASGDVQSAYESAKSKMNIDSPADSRFVARLLEGHNCWNECGNLLDANTTDDVDIMVERITEFAESIDPTPVDPDALLASKAMTLLTDGIVASGGNRHESNQVAIWEFKTGTGGTAYDTSGIDPAMDLALVGSVEWLGGYGLKFSGGRAFANGITSDKLNEFVQASGQFSIEAWVIPANVTQEDANIVSYSGSSVQRNFTLGQDMYNYEFFNRVDDGVNPTDANGEPFLTTGANGDELAQASLQHVVANYHPIDGRSIYVNGELVNVADPVAGPTTVNNIWDDTFPFVLGNENPSGRPWNGSLRMVAIHNRVLTDEQVVQNFDVGVGEKFFLLFSIAHRIGIPDSYILFEVSQFDSYSYLFARPTFVNLDPNWTPEAVDIAGMRIGINGREAEAGQAFASLNVSVDPTSYDPLTGRGTVTVVIERKTAAIGGVIDREAIAAAAQQLREVAEAAGLPPPVLADVMAWTTAAARQEPATSRPLSPQFAALLGSALDDLQRHRAAEGQATAAAIVSLLGEFERDLATAVARAPQLAEVYRERLLQRVQEFVQQHITDPIPAVDLVREVAIHADRVDVAEELQRLQAHVSEFRAMLERDGEVGRRLEFLLQELLRETNTLGSKSPDTALSHTVVAMKSCIDRLKEQVANLE